MKSCRRRQPVRRQAAVAIAACERPIRDRGGPCLERLSWPPSWPPSSRPCRSPRTGPPLAKHRSSSGFLRGSFWQWFVLAIDRKRRAPRQSVAPLFQQPPAVHRGGSKERRPSRPEVTRVAYHIGPDQASHWPKKAGPDRHHAIGFQFRWGVPATTQPRQWGLAQRQAMGAISGQP